MLGHQLNEIAQHANIVPHKTRDSSVLIDECNPHELTIAWFLRIWFLGHLDHAWLTALESYLDRPEQNYTLFQAIRLLFERGIHEPSRRHRVLAEEIICNLHYCGQPLEPTTWWETTLQLSIPAIHLKRLITIARKTTRTQVCSLFPQVKHGQVTSDNSLVSADKNLLRAKLFLKAIESDKPWPDLAQQIQYDASQWFSVRQLPPENQHREYKSTFRWDTQSKQKNAHQMHACLKTICGFLNSSGGTLIIGVNDNLEVIGLEGDFSLINREPPFDAFSQIIHESIKQYIKPIPASLANIDFAPYGQYFLAIITVQKSHCVHYLKVKGDDQELYVRDGNRTIHLKNDEAVAFAKAYESG